MKTTAIICEYNPFHCGHTVQIDAVKQKGNNIICIMSGGFVQRGDAAMFDKYVRAEAAIKSGADLVLELPYPYSCSAAEFFALGGVSVANLLGVVDELCFGSESGDIALLSQISERLLSEEFDVEIKKAREDRKNKDKPYAVLREEVYKRLYGQAVAVKPNDILGVEYISAIKKLNSPIIPVTYKREIGFSATETRKRIREENRFDMIPNGLSSLFENQDRYGMEYAEKAILAFYRNSDAKALEQYEGMTNGIAERLVKAAKESVSLTELIESLSGKSYTNAKIRRCILHGITGVYTDMLKTLPKYTQVLACNEQGRALVRRIQKEGSIEVLTKPSHYKRLEEGARRQAEFNIAADGLLTLMCEKTKSADEFLKKKPYIAVQI
ncbi:MAG: nucleotidyltransferase family protein [Clostridia bacterium]|nr:nucleotidyltransferase family protein [Clostridia bacterium]